VGDKTRFVLVLVAIVFLLSVAYSESENSQYYNGIVNASEILEKISKGEPVEYDHVIVKGDLDFRQLKGLPTKHIERTPFEIEKYRPSKSKEIVISPIRINDSMVDGGAYLKDILFREPII
jgi:hypothetical protein